jgi:acyl-[acyl-carrier-protein]-phospholipid O-acyltransferase/long-chain-fatty-acid--[acyl-carrier-protein] ligase
MTGDLGQKRRVPFDMAAARRTVFQALAAARLEHGGGAIALVDGDERALTYDEIVRASFAWARRSGAAPAPGTMWA